MLKKISFVFEVLCGGIGGAVGFVSAYHLFARVNPSTFAQLILSFPVAIISSIISTLVAIVICGKFEDLFVN